jgi:3-oxoadipate enol-lactonase
MAGVKVGGETFRVEVEGPADAPVLMVSNSLGTNLHMWDAQMPALTRSFRVVRYDSRGHGGSPAPDRPYSIEELGRDALGILDALEIEKVSWLGLSKGGMVGQWLLTHAPERIERAVLANTAAQAGAPDLWNERVRTVRAQGMAGITPSVIDRWFTKTFQESHPEAIAKIVAMLDSTPPAGYAGCIAAIRDMDQREAIRAVRAPVLVIVGRHDPATPPAFGALIAANIPGAELLTLEAAHLSNIEDEEAFTHAVVDFLTRAPARHAAPRKAAKRTTKKAAKKAAKTAVRKAAKHATRTGVKKASKKAGRKSAKKAAKKTLKKAIKKAIKKPSKKAVRKSPGRPSAPARKSGRPKRGGTR